MMAMLHAGRIREVAMLAASAYCRCSSLAQTYRVGQRVRQRRLSLPRSKKTHRAAFRPPDLLNNVDGAKLLLVVEIRQRQRVLVFRLALQQLLEGGLRRGFVFFEVDVAVGGHAGAGRDEAADDDVFLEAAQVVDA